MKAGSAGSNPDDAASSIDRPIQPLRDFLSAVGEAVANLNTAVVGLDAVENNHQKPPSLNISWNPRDRVFAARKARRFVLESVLVRLAEALSEFVGATAQLPAFAHIHREWTDKTSRAQKLIDVAGSKLGKENYLVLGATLVVHWRNRVVHPRSRASLTSAQRKALQRASGEIDEKFGGLSITRLLEDFDKGTPTLKEISSLIAMSIRMARALDKTLSTLSSEDLECLLRYYGLDVRISELEAKTTPGKRPESILRMLQAEAPGLAEAYGRLHSVSQE